MNKLIEEELNNYKAHLIELNRVAQKNDESEKKV